MTKASEYRELDDDEIDTRLTNSRKELFNLRFQAATGRLDNYARTGQVKRDIARLLTIQRDRDAGVPGATVASAPRGSKRRSDQDEDEEA
ncbi:MAG: 50S ribosomal protein L29 [Acidimicrobiales bacterium]